MKLNIILLFLFTLMVSISANAQVDTSKTTVDTTFSKLQVMKDTSKAESKKGFLSFLKEDGNKAKKAAFYSVIIPGGGQVYNRQYWKAPLAFGGVATAGYFVYTNTIEYRRYRDAYRIRVDGDPTTLDEFYDNPNATESNLIDARDQARKWMEQSYIAVVVIYGLNVLEAYTAAHLKDFDMDEDLSLHLEPTIRLQNTGFQNTLTTSSTMTFGVQMNFISKQPTVILGF